jgi:carbon-monoxide dehydrogenase small subunit
MKHTITMNINDEQRTLDVEPHEILLDVLRDRIGIKSPKVGCERGDCGSCTILMDGRAVRSCLILAVEADGHDIVTVEGLSKDGPTPLQQAFIDHSSFQCGFCAPGMVLSLTELLEKDSHPDEHAVREAIGGNLCRCTGYQPIIDAVMDVTSKKGTPHE